MTGYFASTAAWLAQFGTLGWIGAGLIAFLVVAIGFMLVGLGLEKFTSSNAVN